MGFYIKKFNDSSMVILFDDQNTKVEIERSLVDGMIMPKGFYIKENDCFLGVFSSNEGPVFFVGDQNFRFCDEGWDILVTEKGCKRTAEIKKGDEDLISISYTAPKIDELDPWSDKSSVDFYHWLKSRRNDKEFIEMWTDL
ncbi:hypothetical protein ACMXYV_08115 [Neptuniibacter sp. SY11_33]|uniref:hypothetical protein n=1 Tax=Neptuniibacter sp. SY11_33 TaxID=3398215 RepID=UPI0039F5D2FE